MAAAALGTGAQTARRGGVRRRRITVDEYYRMAADGILRRDERVELIDGETIDKLVPQGPSHLYSVDAVARALRQGFSETAWARQQGPLRFDEHAELGPDAAVVQGRPEDYLERHPGPADALLVVEVADTTLRYDRGRKARAYAAASVPEYWTVSVPARELGIYRDPGAGGPTGYGHAQALQPGAVVSPLAAPQAMVSVANLLAPPSR